MLEDSFKTECHLVKSCGQFAITFKTTLLLLYFDTLKLHSKFSRKRSYRFFLQFRHR